MGRFLWSLEKKKEYPGTKKQKRNVYKQYLFSGFLLHYHQPKVIEFPLRLNAPFQGG